MKCQCPVLHVHHHVAPFAGAWIEIGIEAICLHSFGVAPFAGAWIEIGKFAEVFIKTESLPSRERGLKYKSQGIFPVCHTSLPSRERGLKSAYPRPILYSQASLPSRERGLKLIAAQANNTSRRVAPFAGAWIEIKLFF